MFTSVALFNMLIGPLNAFPWVINGVIESWVSIKRLETFMDLTEINVAQYYTGGKELYCLKTYRNWSKLRTWLMAVPHMKNSVLVGFSFSLFNVIQSFTSAIQV